METENNPTHANNLRIQLRRYHGKGWRKVLSARLIERGEDINPAYISTVLTKNIVGETAGKIIDEAIKLRNESRDLQLKREKAIVTTK